MPVSNPTELKAFGESWLKAFEEGICKGWHWYDDEEEFHEAAYNPDYFENIAAQGKDGVLSAMDYMIKNAEGSFPYVLDLKKNPFDQIFDKGQKLPWESVTGVAKRDLHVSGYENDEGRQGQKTLCEGLLKVLKKKRNEVYWNYQVPLLLRPASLGIMALGGLISVLTYGYLSKKGRVK